MLFSSSESLKDCGGLFYFFKKLLTQFTASKFKERKKKKNGTELLSERN